MNLRVAIVGAVTVGLVSAGCTAAAPPPPPSPATVTSAPVNAAEAVPELRAQQARLRALQDEVDGCLRGVSAACARVGPTAERIADDVERIVSARPDAVRYRDIVRAAEQLTSARRSADSGCEVSRRLCPALQSLVSIAAGGLEIALLAPR